MSEKRKVERLENGTWVEINFMDLKEGDEFRLYEADGTLLVDSRCGNLALCDAYFDDNGVGTVMVDYD